jgi:hypothetical protein
MRGSHGFDRLALLRRVTVALFIAGVALTLLQVLS